MVFPAANDALTGIDWTYSWREQAKTPPDGRCYSCKFKMQTTSFGGTDSIWVCNNEHIAHYNDRLRPDGIRVTGMYLEVGEDFGCIHYEQKEEGGGTG